MLMSKCSVEVQTVSRVQEVCMYVIFRTLTTINSFTTSRHVIYINLHISQAYPAVYLVEVESSNSTKYVQLKCVMRALL